MGVKPVEYEHVSSKGAGFADAGDSVPIQSDNADTIYKDVSLGYTKKLDQAQTTLLDSMSDPDNIEYDQGESRQVGSEMIDTSKAKKTSDGEKAGDTASSIAVASGFLFANAIPAAIQSLCKIPEVVGLFIAAGVCLAASILCIPVANAFDSHYDDRKSQASSANGDISTMNDFNTQIEADAKATADNIDAYEKLTATQTTNQLNALPEKNRLENEIKIRKAQGLDTSDLEGQLKGLGQDDDGTGDKIKTIEKDLEASKNRAAQSHGLMDSATTVTEFLQQGETMGYYASLNALALGLAAANAIVLGIAAIKSIKWPWDGFFAFAANAMDIASAITFGTAFGIMTDKSVHEFECGHKGGEMDTELTKLAGTTKDADDIESDADDSFLANAEAMAKALGDAKKNAATDQGNVTTFVAQNGGKPVKNGDEPNNNEG